MTLTDEGRRLVDEARVAYGPTESDRQRVQSALAARVAAATAAAAASSGASAAGLVSAVAAAKGAVVGVVAAVAIGAAAVGYWGLRGDGSSGPRPPPPSESTARGPVAGDRAGELRAPAVGSSDASPSPAAPPQAAAERPHRSREAARAPRQLAATPAPAAPAPAAPGPDVAGEVALLARAQKALAEGDLQRCLQLLDQHQRVFPHGSLTEERAAARIIALCGLGKIETARKEIAALLATAPSSPFAERVRHACGAAWPPPAPPPPRPGQ